MPINKVSYVEAICLPSDDPRYILAIDAYKHRTKDRSLRVGINVASALLTHNSISYQPIASESKGQGRNRSLHSERLSLLAVIRYAIHDQWGPFAGIRGDLYTTPDFLSIDKIAHNEPLKTALKKLDRIDIYTERHPCDYRTNPQDKDNDKGCAAYLSALGQLISGDNIYVYHDLAKYSRESDTQQWLEKEFALLSDQWALISQKEEIVEARIDVEKIFKEERAQMKQKLQPLLEEPRSKLKQTANQAERNEIIQKIIKIQAEEFQPILERKKEKLESLLKKEHAINEKLKKCFSVESFNPGVGVHIKVDISRSVVKSSFSSEGPSEAQAGESAPLYQSADALTLFPWNTDISGDRSATDTAGPGKPPNIQRKGLSDVDLSRMFSNSENYLLGQAVDDGGCFFDGLAQALDQIPGHEGHIEKTLRMVCHKYTLENEDAVYKLNDADYVGTDRGDQYLMVQYTKTELDQHFYNRSPIWGRAHVEGIILCNALNLEGILTLEIMDDPNSPEAPKIPGFIMTNKDKSSTIDRNDAEFLMKNPNIPMLVVEQKSLHYVPLFHNATPEQNIAASSGASSEAETITVDAATKLVALQAAFKEAKNTGEALGADVPSLLISNNPLRFPSALPHAPSIQSQNTELVPPEKSPEEPADKKPRHN